MINLEPITPERALDFKATRLRALKDSPTAFSSTYARESQLSDEEWLKRSVRWSSDGSIGYIAFEEGTACGLVCSLEEMENLARASVISMWVDPSHRRAGIGSMLITAVCAWAKNRGLRELKLLVTDVNQGAIEFYQRLGFQMSGVSQPYPNDAAITEYEMLLRLDA